MGSGSDAMTCWQAQCTAAAGPGLVLNDLRLRLCLPPTPESRAEQSSNLVGPLIKLTLLTPRIPLRNPRSTLWCLLCVSQMPLRVFFFPHFDAIALHLVFLRHCCCALHNNALHDHNTCAIYNNDYSFEKKTRKKKTGILFPAVRDCCFPPTCLMELDVFGFCTSRLSTVKTSPRTFFGTVKPQKPSNNSEEIAAGDQMMKMRVAVMLTVMRHVPSIDSIVSVALQTAVISISLFSSLPPLRAQPECGCSTT